MRLVHANADAVASDARLRHFEQSTADPVVIADADFVVGQSVDRKILSELPIAEVISAELALPIGVRLELVYEDRPMLAAMPCQIPLAVTVDVEPPDHAPALNGRLPDGGTVFPCHSMSRGMPTLTDSKRAIALFSCDSEAAFQQMLLLARKVYRQITTWHQQ
jgi:hypothetical protein